MSRRRESYVPYTPVDREVFARLMYGETTAKNPADLTVLPDRITVGEWCSGLHRLVLAVGGAVTVVASWVVLRAMLGLP